MIAQASFVWAQDLSDLAALQALVIRCQALFVLAEAADMPQALRDELRDEMGQARAALAACEEIDMRA